MFAIHNISLQSQQFFIKEISKRELIFNSIFKKNRHWEKLTLKYTKVVIMKKICNIIILTI